MNTKIHPETLTWQTLSHIQPKRSPLWYLVFSLVGLGLISYAVYTQSIMTMITFALVMLVTMIFALQPAKKQTIKIIKTGITAGNVTYPFRIIKKFWIIYNRNVKTLNFETTAYLNNRVSLQLGAQDPLMVKMILNNYIPEDLEMEESLSETLARKLKI